MALTSGPGGPGNQNLRDTLIAEQNAAQATRLAALMLVLIIGVAVLIGTSAPRVREVPPLGSTAATTPRPTRAH